MILQSAFDEAVEKNKESAAKKEELQKQVDKQIETIEELREMAGLVDSVARHDESNANQGEIQSLFGTWRYMLNFQ